MCMLKCLKLSILAMICLLAQSCGSSQRFMNFGWSTPKHEVIDSIQRWGFALNTDKQRWEKGRLNGFTCSKLRVWFSDKDLLTGAEAKYLDLDASTSNALRMQLVEQLTSLHGSPEVTSASSGVTKVDRLSWSFSAPTDMFQDMIVLTHFPDYVILHAARNMPKPFDLIPAEED